MIDGRIVTAAAGKSLDANQKSKTVNRQPTGVHARRDSGLLHRLLPISEIEMLFAHPYSGASWEGFQASRVFASKYAPNDV